MTIDGEGPLAIYRSRVAQGTIAFDEAQSSAAETLELLRGRLLRWAGARHGAFLLPFAKPQAPPRGLYLFGGVGRGKSMLMDMFFGSVPIEKKRRVHFHAFMSEIHGEIGHWRKLSEAERRRRPHFVRDAGDDPLPPVAELVAQTSQLLCFDEFQVEDPATAMILGRLFAQLFARRVVIVATSNRAPDALYRDGINRQLFLPFIELIKNEMDVLELNSSADYRLGKLLAAPVYFIGPASETRIKLDEAWNTLTDSSRGEIHQLSSHGRTLQFLTAKGVARATFDALCRRPLGAEDYLLISRSFPILILEDIPKLGLEERDAATRLVHLIDALYECRAKLICSAAVAPGDIAKHLPSFERSASRLAEMQSKDYFAERHRPD